MTDEIEVEVGSSNVFADLGLSNPAERLVKAELASRIGEAIRQRRLSNATAAALLGIARPEISQLLRGFLTDFPTDRLKRYAEIIGSTT
jgi:predicted XRE-type DNA-binding protein